MPLVQCSATVTLDEHSLRCEKAAGHPGLHLATPGDRRVSWYTQTPAQTPQDGIGALLRR